MRSRMSNLMGLVAALFVASAAQAQTTAPNRIVTGRVTDAATSAPIGGAIVSVSGGTQATQANDDGTFRLSVPARALTLQVRALGFRRQEVQVAATQETANVSLTREALQLSEVVVSGAATTQERRNISTAVSTVNAEELTRVPAASLDNSLQGKIVGANINMYSGAPGGGGQIQIRGVTSILGNGEPLYVVDGVIISNAAFSTGINSVTRASGAGVTSTQDNAVNRLADINPNDIENIQILKSAAATAIYGSQATNGVVIISTKRGRSGAPRVQLTQRVGTYQAMRLLGSRRHTLESAIEAGVDEDMANELCGSGTCPYYDYQGDLYGREDLSYETVATLSGGSENTRYYLSGTMKDDKGTQINSGAKRQSLRMNIDQVLGSRFTANASAQLSRSYTQRGLSNNDNTYVSPIYAFGYTPAIVDLKTRVNGVFIENPFAGGGGASGSNPFQTLSYLRNVEDVWRQIGSGTLRFNAYSGASQNVTFQATGGFDRYDAEGSVYSPNFLQFEPGDNLLGTATQAEALVRQYNGSLSAVHEYTPAQGGLIPFLSSATTSVGLQYEQRDQNRFGVTARGLVPTIDLIDQGQPTITQTKQSIRNQAFFVNEELLAFDERLSLAARVRGERSSVNGDREKIYYWPAFSGSYRFVNIVPFANEVKLRAAIGTSGNQANYGNRDVTIQGLGLIDGRIAIGAPGTVGNPNIKPEKMTEIEYGIDALFLDSRVGLEASYFDRSITDLLLNAPLPPSSGIGIQIVNGGELETKGLELALNLVPIRTRDFTWNARTQYYSYDSKVVSLPANIADFVVPNSGFGAQYGRGRIARGQSPTAIWGNKYRADSTVVDTIVAESNPDFQMQFSNDFTWRGVTLSALVDWRKGGFLSNLTNNLFDEGLNSADYDDPSPDPAFGATLGEYRYNKWDAGRNSLIYIQDGSFVKLREITVAYTLPQTLATRIPGARDVRLSLSGRNLGIWSDYWGSDPEVSNFGNQNVSRFVDLAPYPPSRSFFFSVDIGF